TGLGRAVRVGAGGRPRRVRITACGVGVGVGLLAGGVLGVVEVGTAAVPAGAIVAGVALPAADRAVWTPGNPRAPPLRALARGLRAQAGPPALWAMGGPGPGGASRPPP